MWRPVTREPGAGAVLRFPCAVARSIDAGGGGLHAEVKFRRQRASAWVSVCGRQRAHAHILICSSLVAWVYPLYSVI